MLSPLVQKLERIGRCGLIGGGMSKVQVTDVSKTYAWPNLSLSWLSTDQDIRLSTTALVPHP